ncbi:hypothetical protein HaLaN_09213 [Haematococcus lacustris]|uniref:Uncharacterized protein n=1 Tax=Haematococcus lacustris TaxID=44745 RepID=A0A699YT11_HAELA|nr:hypothetical protein HaLaN_09213 [Haematococcus lacustris]
MGRKPTVARRPVTVTEFSMTDWALSGSLPGNRTRPQITAPRHTSHRGVTNIASALHHHVIGGRTCRAVARAYSSESFGALNRLLRCFQRLLPGPELSNAGAVAARSNKEQPKLAASESGSKVARWLRRIQVQYQQWNSRPWASGLKLASTPRWVP